MESLKPDCSYALRRKRLQSLPAAMSASLSPVHFESKRCGIAPISRNFQSNPGGFLCTSDCVAEGSGFEPSVQVWMVQESTFPQVARNQILQRIWKTWLPDLRDNTSRLSGFFQPSRRSLRRMAKL